MTSQTNPPAPWFTRLIGQCLASLYLLGLDGVPAGENTEKLAALWVRLLWEKPIHGGWCEQIDAPRLRAAFAKIAETSKRWPAPATFWEVLPERARPPSNRTLANSDFGRERQAEALRARDAWLESLGRDQSGDIIPGHPNAPQEFAS